VISGRRAELAWLAVAVVVASTVVLAGIDGGELRTDDEALYGMLARTAAAHDTWLYPVGPDGAYYEKFGKPPLSLWLVSASFAALGPSPTSLRLPFALGYVLAVVACFAWGRRIGGTAMGAAWALGLACCGAAVRWGRVACIEPLFVAPCLLALVAHGDALAGERRGRAALLAGVALAVAAMVKQLAVAIAVVPIVALELARRERGVARRRVIVLGIPLGVGSAWLAAAYAAVGGVLFTRLFGDGILGRIGGFAGGHNQRQLDEVARILDDACTPLWWPLGVVGVVLWACRDVALRRARSEPPGGAWSWPLLLVVAALLYDTVSSTLLPWYAFGLVVPIVGGAAWAVARCLALAPRMLDDGEGRGDPLDVATAVVGAIVLATTTVAAVAPLVSRVSATLVIAAVATGLVVAARRRPAPVWTGRALALAPLAVVVALVVGRARSRELHERPGRLAAMMAELGRRDVATVAYDKHARLETKLAITLFGVGARQVVRPPWGDPDPVDAYVTTDLVPEEVELPPGIELVRSPGAVAWIGDLSRAPWDAAALAAALDRGAVTFEAEHLFGEHWDTLHADADASAGALRAISPWRNESVETSTLSSGPTLELAAGKYVATLRLRWDCRGFARRVGYVQIAGAAKDVERDLECADDHDADAWTDVAVRFKLDDGGSAKLRLIHESGDLAHDWTKVARR
jgi:4-amino-4-deoxy-L-arabinose transferase-like glycosyltransferase